jgi:hypothetical protein
LEEEEFDGKFFGNLMRTKGYLWDIDGSKRILMGY